MAHDVGQEMTLTDAARAVAVRTNELREALRLALLGEAPENKSLGLEKKIREADRPSANNKVRRLRDELSEVATQLEDTIKFIQNELTLHL